MEVQIYKANVTDTACVQIVLEGNKFSYIEFIFPGTTVAKVIEICGGRIGYGGGGYLTWKGATMELGHILVPGEIYVYRLNVEQMERRRIINLLNATEDANLKAVNAKDATNQANLRSALLNEQTALIKSNRAQRMGDLSRQWTTFHEATNRSTRSVSFNEQHDVPQPPNKRKRK